MVNHGNGQLMAIGKARERRLEAGVYSAIWLYDMHYSSHQEGTGWKKTLLRVIFGFNRSCIYTYTYTVEVWIVLIHI